MEKETSNKYKIGLIIGRFQPFHNGHKYLLVKALENIDKVIIVIGSSNVTNEDNPYSFEKRKGMIEQVLEKEGFENRVLKIIDVPDFPSDEEWLLDILIKTGKIDVVVGNNEWTNGIFEDAGIKVLRVPYFRRYINEGTKIRRLMKQNKPWQSRVPSYIIPML